MRKEAEVLSDLNRATTRADQMRLAQELAEVQAQRRTAASQSREIDLAATTVQQNRVPVYTHSHHTAHTDWIADVADETPADYDHAVRAVATYWYNGVSDFVKGVPEEFYEQAKGKARREASAYGELAKQAERTFLDTVNRLQVKAGREVVALDENDPSEAQSDLDPVTVNDATDVFDPLTEFPETGPAEVPSTRADNVSTASMWSFAEDLKADESGEAQSGLPAVTVDNEERPDPNDPGLAQNPELPKVPSGAADVKNADNPLDTTSVKHAVNACPACGSSNLTSTSHADGTSTTCHDCHATVTLPAAASAEPGPLGSADPSSGINHSDPNAMFGSRKQAEDWDSGAGMDRGYLINESLPRFVKEWRGEGKTDEQIRKDLSDLVDKGWREPALTDSELSKLVARKTADTGDWYGGDAQNAIQGPGTPPPNEGEIDPARGDGPAPYNGAPPFGGTPVTPENEQILNAPIKREPGAPISGGTPFTTSSKTAAFRERVKARKTAGDAPPWLKKKDDDKDPAQDASQDAKKDVADDAKKDVKQDVQQAVDQVPPATDPAAAPADPNADPNAAPAAPVADPNAVPGADPNAAPAPGAEAPHVNDNAVTADPPGVAPGGQCSVDVGTDLPLSGTYVGMEDGYWAVDVGTLHLLLDSGVAVTPGNSNQAAQPTAPAPAQAAPAAPTAV